MKDFWDGVLITLLVLVVVVVWSIVMFTWGSHNWTLTQADFPCAEDEVLGYSPRSDDHVVCMHRDDMQPTLGPAR